MKTLLLIPSIMKTGLKEAMAADRHPLMDYDALIATLRTDGGVQADALDYAAVDRDRSLMVRLVRQAAGRDAALALMGFQRRRQYDSIFTNGENVSIPLALLLKLTRRRPGHVTIGHRLSTGKKRLFFQRLHVHRQIDTIFVYARTQREYAETHLGIPGEKLALIAFHADPHFYRPLPDVAVEPNKICSAGLEWRDYPTLIAAVADLPQLTVKLAAASPWSKHTDETASRVLPPHISARRYEYSALRDLYASSNIVVVPLYENDFQAGVTTLLEAMAMGKAVIVTRTTGQTDVVADGENGLMVPPGDIPALREAILRLQTDAALRERLGKQALQWFQENATLPLWVGHIVRALHRSSAHTRRSFDLPPSLRYTIVMNQHPSSTSPRIRLAITRETRGILNLFRPRLFFWTCCAKFLPEHACCVLRRSFYRLAGCKIGPAVTLLGRLALLGSGDIAGRLHIGEGSIVAQGVILGLDDEIRIGNNVSIGPYVKLYTATHNLGYGSRRMSLTVKSKPIIIEDGVWVGIDSLILAGVTLGQGCVVSAGAVVTGNVPPNTLVSGNPATVQKQLPFGDR